MHISVIRLLLFGRWTDMLQKISKTAYSVGLRVGEVIALKPEHIDSSRMLVRVESGKGRKDRDKILSKRLLPEPRYYYKVCRPGNWLSPGKDPEKHICATTAQRACTKAKKKARIKKGKGIHKNNDLERSSMKIRPGFRQNINKTGMAWPPRPTPFRDSRLKKAFTIPIYT